MMRVVSGFCRPGETVRWSADLRRQLKRIERIEQLQDSCGFLVWVTSMELRRRRQEGLADKN